MPRKTHREKLAELKKNYELVGKGFEQQFQLSKVFHFGTDVGAFHDPPWVPNPAQSRFLEGVLDDSKKVLTFTMGERGGKTTLGAYLIWCLMEGRWLWCDRPINFGHDKPRKMRWVGQDWQKHIKTVLIPAINELWPAHRFAGKPKKNQDGIEFFFTHKNGSTVEIMSNFTEARTHAGWHGDAIFFDEPPNRDVRIANARGLVDRCGREYFFMTLIGQAWIAREVLKAKLLDGTPDPSYFNITGSSRENIGHGISEEGLNQYTKTMTTEEQKTRIDGVPECMTGLVCPEFRREVHVKDRFDIPVDWIVDVAIDVHPRKPQVISFIATSPREFRYVCDEFEGHGDGDFIADQIIRIKEKRCYRIGKIIIDPLSKSDSNNENTTYGKVMKKLEQFGLELETAAKDKDSGVINLNTALMGPNKEPSLFIFRDCGKTIEQVEDWMYDPDGKPSKDRDDYVENLYRLNLLETKWEPLNKAKPFKAKTGGDFYAT